MQVLDANTATRPSVERAWTHRIIVLINDFQLCKVEGVLIEARQIIAGFLGGFSNPNQEVKLRLKPGFRSGGAIIGQFGFITDSLVAALNGRNY